MWRHIASNALTLLVVVLVVVGGVIAWGQRQYAQPGPLVEPICFQIERGSRFAAVSNQLAAEGAIKSPTIFRIGADYENLAGQHKFGSYLLMPGNSMQEIVTAITTAGRSTCGTEVNFRIGVTTAEVLVRELDPVSNIYEEVVSFEPGDGDAPAEYTELAERPDVRYRVTLAEGVTSWQVVEELKRAEFLEGELNKIPAEGTLSPDSYEVERGTERAALIAEMSERQTRFLLSSGRDGRRMPCMKIPKRRW